MSETRLPLGTILCGIYRIEARLASGGFGNTYKAYNLQLHEYIAIKEFFMQGINERMSDERTVCVSNNQNLEQYAEQLQKFKKEAQRLQSLSNPHIVCVHDLFEENNTAYYVMDFIDGESLAARLKRMGIISENELRVITPQVLDALQTVHEARLWHLDLKPANIMYDSEQQVSLIDFGASKQLGADGSGATSSTSLCYTPGFAPPEQIEQNTERFGPWTDLYALGATLFNLLTNKKPPVASDISESAFQAFEPLKKCCSLQMQTYIRWLMQPNRNQRPKSVHEAFARWNALFPNKQSKESKRVTKTDKDQSVGNPGTPSIPQRPLPPLPPPQKKSIVRYVLAITGGLLLLLAIISGVVSYWLFSSDKVNPYNDHRIETQLDTMAYAIGVIQTTNFMEYLATNYDMDTTQIDPFCQGVIDYIDSTPQNTHTDDAARQAYNIGIEVGEQLKTLLPNLALQIFGDSTQALPTNKVLAGFVQGLHPGSALMDQQEANQTAERLYNIYLSQQMEITYADNKRQGEEFLTRKRHEHDVYELPRSGGVLYHIIKNGTGKKPDTASTVRIIYEGKTIDGSVFDKSDSRFGNNYQVSTLIPGMQSALTRMSTGSIWEIYVPAGQAYAHRQTNGIDPFSTLIFRIELLEVEP